MLLADIGNTNFHVYNGETVEHLSYEDAVAKYQNEALCYISVKHQHASEIEEIVKWKNISSWIKIENEYDTLGVDRKALCLSHPSGVFIDAGSAITVDVMLNGIYQGGYILPGITAMLNAYAGISSVLDVKLNRQISLERLPTTTKDGISYGIIASIKALIDKHDHGSKLYFTGGDGKFLSTFFKNAVYSEMLVFEGIREALKDKKIC